MAYNKKTAKTDERSAFVVPNGRYKHGRVITHVSYNILICGISLHERSQ